MHNFKTLSLSLDRRIRPFLKAPITAPRRGWARSVRKAIGMTKAQLASRLNVSISTIAGLERSEVRGTITIESLRRMAEGLECRLVYALLPKGGTTLDQMIRDRADEMPGEDCHGRLRENLAAMLAAQGRGDLWR